MGSVIYPAVSDPECLSPEELNTCMSAITMALQFLSTTAGRDFVQRTEARSIYCPDAIELRRAELKIMSIGVQEGWL